MADVGAPAGPLAVGTAAGHTGALFWERTDVNAGVVADCLVGCGGRPCLGQGHCDGRLWREIWGYVWDIGVGCPTKEASAPRVDRQQGCGSLCKVREVRGGRAPAA